MITVQPILIQQQTRPKGCMRQCWHFLTDPPGNLLDAPAGEGAFACRLLKKKIWLIQRRAYCSRDEEDPRLKTPAALPRI